MLEIYGKTDRGNVRDNNEDQIHFPRPDTTSPKHDPAMGQLLIVADGVGGMQAGEHASRLTVETIREQYYYDHSTGSFDPLVRLENAIIKASDNVEGVKQAMAWAQPGDLLLLFVLNKRDESTAVIEDYIAAQGVAE